MIDFKTPVPADKAKVDALLAPSGQRGCEYNFTTLYTWHKAYNQVWAPLGDFFVERLCGSIGCCYLFPAGQGDLNTAIAALESDAAHRGEKAKFICLTPPQVAWLEEYRPHQYTYSTDRFGFDYLYEIDRMADLAGKKLHGKRNHINRFEEAYPDWSFEEIGKENLEECVAMDQEWYRLNRGFEGDESLGDEGVALRLAFQHYEALALEGVLVRAGGRVVAFALGDTLTHDTYDIHFEKAFGEIQGAYAIINRTFARWVREKYPQIKYLNREDDMGIEGLRRAKESYYPDLMVEKHSATRH